MIEWLKAKIFTKYLGSIIRTALAAVGGFLIAKYGLDEDIVNQLMNNLAEVLGVLVPLIVAQLWSLFQKSK